MATNGRNRRLEPSYKQHGVIDDVLGVVIEVDVTIGETNEGEELLARLDAAEKTTGVKIETVTADAGYAYAKIYGGLERREIAAIIPAKAEPIRSPVPMRRFRYDAKHDVLKCPRGKKLKAGRSVKHGRVFTSRARDCRRCDLAHLACQRAARTKRSCSVTTIPPCCARGDAKRIDRTKIVTSSSDIAGGPKVTMVKPKPGMALPGQFGAAYRTCESRHFSLRQQSTSSGWRPPSCWS
jgi:hypothetical protein